MSNPRFLSQAINISEMLLKKDYIIILSSIAFVQSHFNFMHLYNHRFFSSPHVPNDRCCKKSPGGKNPTYSLVNMHILKHISQKHSLDTYLRAREKLKNSHVQTRVCSPRRVYGIHSSHAPIVCKCKMCIQELVKHIRTKNNVFRCR